MEEKQPIGFKSALIKAKKLSEDVSKVPALLENAMQKAEKHKGALAKILADLYGLIRLIKAWAKGEYREVPWGTIVMAIAAVVYFVNPFDLFPDVIPIFGYIDDATVVGFVLKTIGTEVGNFREWERRREGKEERS
jgi:uncharacterized membrane protein YkvA (DUF1232 family)